MLYPMLPLRCALVRAHTSKIMPLMKFIHFFKTNLDFFKSAHFKSFPTHDEKRLEGALAVAVQAGLIRHYRQKHAMM